MDDKSFKTYSNFLKSLSLKLTRFYYKKLDKNFVVYNKLKGKGYDPVTTSDKAFEKFIRSEINKKFPTHQIIGEEFGKSKNKRPKILIGFAAETGNISLAKNKLKKKNCDIMIYNKINKDNEVFNSDYNKISIITKNEVKNYNKMTKVNCAKEIIKYIYNFQITNE